ncbi:diguanylate cyclase [Marinomonas sp. IMCC 4694]|uniref:GGDEF domain-containing response regulator n=1 Tax=Marinomonas sp. IMCC 4694 TaxID=2605432 RepID=UPI0011E63142|nr:diguanylate cyclase [Marinomonas sp. IMCC 4694]TYL47962.1 diguanylate cyclase [Marinomonas sp. IMCC 4694]
MNVLIVDDIKTDRLLLKFHLSKLGYKIIEASSGQEGIVKFVEHCHDLDLILMDVQMPNLNGFDTVKSIRNIQQQQKQEWLPVIFLSASTEDDDIVDGILAGGDDYLIKPINQRVLAVKMLAMKRIADMRRRLVETNAVLEKLASTDYLTGVANRRAFENALKYEMIYTQRHGRSLACGMFDLDKFKDVNDVFGHDAGDAVLVEIVSRLKSYLREGDFIGRLGGEEFGLILTNIDEGNVVAAFDRYRLCIAEKPIKYNDIEIPMTASIGAVLFADSSEHTPSSLLKRSDQLLYEAKDAGRNRVVFHP